MRLITQRAWQLALNGDKLRALVRVLSRAERTLHHAASMLVEFRTPIRDAPKYYCLGL